ncbi:MAG: hypothetical protein HOM25_10365 [Rhodospirillaceae bacterium]|jgi:hypothetical protein|nr:hypothetical protein [Rhodospirillaceae bacterium]MBT5667842.1 hypothetical protein [Rhodospirillaceae bacterium]
MTELATDGISAPGKPRGRWLAVFRRFFWVGLGLFSKRKTPRRFHGAGLKVAA